MIALEAVGKRFAPGVHALRDVTLRVAGGEALSVLGASGSGKTTLMDIIGTLSRPSSGRYLFQGRPVDGLSDRELSLLRRRSFGYIFQAFNLIHDWTVKKNLRLALRHTGIPRDDVLRRALDGIGLAGKLEARVNTLSGGERQRVAILRTILRNPDIILADEPTGNLDVDNAALVMDMLFSLWAQGKTLIMITHDMALAARFPRMVRLERGRLLETSTEKRR